MYIDRQIDFFKLKTVQTIHEFTGKKYFNFITIDEYKHIMVKMIKNISFDFTLLKKLKEINKSPIYKVFKKFYDM